MGIYTPNMPAKHVEPYRENFYNLSVSGGRKRRCKFKPDSEYIAASMKDYKGGITKLPARARDWRFGDK